MINEFTTSAAIDDQTVREYIRRIQKTTLPKDRKYDLLDSLSFLVINHHRDGIAAKVLNEISKAIEEL